MTPRILALVLGISVLAVPVLADPAVTPYAGQQTRIIKSLSEEDIGALLKGEGMGMAKAAELNGYPGPVHVLTLAKELKLTASQQRHVEAIYSWMKATAKSLGAELVEREKMLDQLFARGEITPDRLKAGTAAIAELQGRLRSVHLSAHLETRALLDPNQITRYEQLRGYADPSAPGHHHHG